MNKRLLKCREKFRKNTEKVSVLTDENKKLAPIIRELEDKEIIGIVRGHGMTPDDLENINTLICLPAECDENNTSAIGQIGVRNVSRRLKMIYGEKGALSIIQASDSTILAQIFLPLT